MRPRKAFQSYIIIGSDTAAQKEIKSLLARQNMEFLPKSPDTTIIQPVKSQISVDQVRELKKHIYQKPFSQTQKTIVIKQAHTLTKEAQNALLKIFEEPPKHAQIILSTQFPKNILPTVTSRAVVLRATNEEFQDQAEIVFDLDLVSALESTSTIDNHELWLNRQIMALYNMLVADIADRAKRKRLETLIKNCALAKVAINANVNPKLTISNLIISNVNRTNI